LVVWGVLTVLTYKNVIDVGYNGLAAMIVMLAVSMGLRKYHSTFMKRAQRSLYDECDPYPTLEEMRLYIECAGRRVNTTGMTVTLGMMLALIGDYENSEKTLRSINVGEESTLPPAAKAGVFYDLAALYCAMNLPEHAKDCYDRAKEFFAEAPVAAGFKMGFNGPTDAQVECYKGNHSRALDILNAITADNKLQEVTKKFAMAKVHYIIGERAAALSEFDWVSKNGGRLACVGESADIVAAINNA
jgi:tetratricopeptide (TPR) repeat protein